jgi:hypothetical protein
LTIAILIEPIENPFRVRSTKTRPTTAGAAPFTLPTFRTTRAARLFRTRWLIRQSRTLLTSRPTGGGFRGTLLRPWSTGATFSRAPWSAPAARFFGQLQKLFAAELTIFVFVVAIKDFIRIRWCGAICRAAPFAIAPSSTATLATATLATATRAITSPLAHRLPRCLSFFLVQLPVTVGIEFFDHSGAHLAITTRSPLFGFLSRRRPTRHKRPYHQQHS